MSVDTTTKWRDWVARVAAVFFFFFVCAAFDGLIAYYRLPVNSNYVMPGESLKLTGPLPVEGAGLQDLRYETDGDSLRLDFQEVFTGFWMGGRMWRGVLTTGADTPSGVYHVAVDWGEESPKKPPTVFTLFVYRGDKELRGFSTSYLRKYLDLHSWWTAASFLALLCSTIGLVYLLSSRRESLLAKAGMADIYRIAKIDERVEVAFALGTRHGIDVGSALELLDGSGKAQGRVKVQKVSETDSIAEVVDWGGELEPGYMVRRIT